VFTVTLKTSGRQFTAMPGETVLEAAQRAGIALPCTCGEGSCAGCTSILLDGHCGYPRAPLATSGDVPLALHQVQLCQAVPTSDVLIETRELAAVDDMARRQLTVRVAEKQRLAAGVIGLRLLPADGELRLNRLAGQYLEVLLDEGKRRPFSIANGPHPDGAIDLHVRNVAGGGFTAWVDETLQVGDTLTIEGPLGTFVPREDSQRPMIFMAGGTGFAPVKAIVEHFLAQGTRRGMEVYWGVRSAEDIYLLPVVERWARDAHDLRFHAVVSDPQQAQAAGLRGGLVHEAVLHDHPDLSGHDVYMSGPPAMIEAGRAQFIAAGLPEARLYYDSFEYAPQVLARILGGRKG
jgi:CDP-4-dehydro-6-deoxyglucose reductase